MYPSYQLRVAATDNWCHSHPFKKAMQLMHYIRVGCDRSLLPRQGVRGGMPKSQHSEVAGPRATAVQ